ncbi:MAG: oxidoreductase-like domain-containing protein [Chitinivorax sp.]
MNQIPPPPQPPEQPSPEECCSSGCDPCIMDLYTEELQQYRQKLADWQRLYGEQATVGGNGAT